MTAKGAPSQEGAPFFVLWVPGQPLLISQKRKTVEASRQYSRP